MTSSLLSPKSRRIFHTVPAHDWLPKRQHKVRIPPLRDVRMKNDETAAMRAVQIRQCSTKAP